MNILINVKAIGKKKKALTPVPYEIGDATATLRELLTALVEMEVEKYLEKSEATKADDAGETVQSALLRTADEIEDLSEAGKVGFGRIYSEKNPDRNEAVANAIQCFEDGLVRVFKGQEELKELDAPLQIKEGDTFTLMRLAMLSGRMW